MFADIQRFWLRNMPGSVLTGESWRSGSSRSRNEELCAAASYSSPTAAYLKKSRILVSEISSITALGSVWWSAIYFSYLCGVEMFTADAGITADGFLRWAEGAVSRSGDTFSSAEGRVYIRDGFDFHFSDWSELKRDALVIFLCLKMKECPESVSLYLFWSRYVWITQVKSYVSYLFMWEMIHWWETGYPVYCK